MSGGAKPWNRAFSACPASFHEILRLLETEYKAAGKANPKTLAEAAMAEIYNLSVSSVQEAKRGRGVYGKGKKCSAIDCDGAKNCLLVETQKLFTR